MPNKHAPDTIMMGDYDGKATYAALAEKIQSGDDLTDIDIMNLCLLPLMRNDMPRGELAVNSVRLALTITDKAKRDACVASAYALAERFLSAVDITNIKGLLKMSNILVEYIAEKVEQGIEDGITKKLEERLAERDLAIAETMLADGLSVDAVAKYTGLDVEAIRQIQAEEPEQN